MSKKKSLGSSPIGFHTHDRLMGFIPDLGVSKEERSDSRISEAISEKKSIAETYSQKPEHTSQKSDKKIVSYNLEIDLVTRIKSIADQRGMYYSSVVSQALKNWILENSL